MRVIILLLLLFPALFTSCFEAEKRVFTGDKGFSDSSYIKLVDRFYTWYLFENKRGSNFFLSSPKLIKTSDSTYRIDINEYENRLDNTGFFTSRFIKNEKKLAEKCNNHVVKTRWKAGDIPYFNDCDYPEYDRWIGSRYGNSRFGYAILSAWLQEETWLKRRSRTVEVHIYSEGKQLSTARVLTVLENGTYKIDAISLTITQ